MNAKKDDGNMNKNDIDKLRTIDLEDISPGWLITKGPEEERNKGIIFESVVAYMLVFCAISTLALIQSDFKITLSGVVAISLVSLMVFIVLAQILGPLFQWLHDEYSVYLTYPSMRIREAKYKEKCERIYANVDSKIRQIEDSEGFIWKFAGCIPHMNNSLTEEQLEDLINASSNDRESISVKHYRRFISDLQHYYERQPVRESFKEVVKLAGPCIKPEFV